MIFSTMCLPPAILLPRYRSVYSMPGNGVSTVSDSKDLPMIRKAGGEINRPGGSLFAPRNGLPGEMRDRPIIQSWLFMVHTDRSKLKNFFLKKISQVTTRLCSENYPSGDADSTHAGFFLTPHPRMGN